MRFVLNGDPPVTVHGGVPCLDPFFGLLVGKGSIAFSSASTNGDVHRTCVGYIAKSNVVGSLVGVDMSRQDKVDVVFHEERFQVLFGSKYLGIMSGTGKGAKSWDSPLQKFNERSNMWGQLPVGVFRNVEFYKTFVMSVLSFWWMEKILNCKSLI